MHDDYDYRFHISHPTSVELYKLSNQTQISPMQENIIFYALVGVISMCLCVKCMQCFLDICFKINRFNETSMLTTNRTEHDEDSDEMSESYEPPEELQQSQRNNQINESINQDNRDSENSDDLPSYYDVCVKTEN